MQVTAEAVTARRIEDPDVCDVPQVDPARVRRVRAALIERETAAELASLFSALADTTRLRVVEALAREEMCVCDLAAALDLSQSATSHHLRTLRNLRLVRHRREGRLVFYSLDDAHIGGIFAQGLEHVREAIPPSQREGSALSRREGVKPLAAGPEAGPR